MDQEYTKLKPMMRWKALLKREAKEGWNVPPEIGTLGDLIQFLKHISCDSTSKASHMILPSDPKSFVVRLSKTVNEILAVRIDSRDAIDQIVSEKSTFYDVLTPAGLDRLVAKVSCCVCVRERERVCVCVPFISYLI